MNLFLNVALITLAGPSIESGFLKWKKALEEGIVPKEILDKYYNGENLPYETPYGKGYFSKEGHERCHQYSIDLENPIKVGFCIRIGHG